MENTFKKKYSFEKRKHESNNVHKKYPDRIPIVVQKHGSSTLPDIDKCKYLVPKDMTMSQFMFFIRKRIQLDPSQTLFFTVNQDLVASSTLLCDVYHDKKDEDGFLYVTYTNENVFG